MNPFRRKIRQIRNRQRLRKGVRRTKGALGYVGERIKDGLIETVGVGAVGLGLNKARRLITPRPFSRSDRLTTFKKRLSKQHRVKISKTLRGRTNLDQHLKRGETVSKIFRGYAGGVRSLAAARKYTQEVGRGDTVLRRLDRLSAVAGRRRKIFSLRPYKGAEFGIRRTKKRRLKGFLNSRALKITGVGLGLGGLALNLRGMYKDRMANLASDAQANVLRQGFNNRVAEINRTMSR